MTYSHVPHETHSHVRHRYSHVWHDALICNTWRIHMWDMRSIHMWDIGIHMWDMIYLYVIHDVFTCETCYIHMWDIGIQMWDMTHSYARHRYSHVRHDTSRRDTWRIHMWDMRRTHMWDAIALVLLEIVGLFCKRVLQKRPIFCKRDV